MKKSFAFLLISIYSANNSKQPIFATPKKAINANRNKAVTKPKHKTHNNTKKYSNTPKEKAPLNSKAVGIAGGALLGAVGIAGVSWLISSHKRTGSRAGQIVYTSVVPVQDKSAAPVRATAHDPASDPAAPVRGTLPPLLELLRMTLLLLYSLLLLLILLKSRNYKFILEALMPLLLKSLMLL